MTRSHYHEKIEKKSWNTRSTDQNVSSVFCVLQCCVIEIWKVPKLPHFFRQKSKQNITTYFAVDFLQTFPKFGVSYLWFGHELFLFKIHCLWIACQLYVRRLFQISTQFFWKYIFVFTIQLELACPNSNMDARIVIENYNFIFLVYLKCLPCWSYFFGLICEAKRGNTFRYDGNIKNLYGLELILHQIIIWRRSSWYDWRLKKE